MHKNQTMRALLLSAVDGPFERIELPRPVPGPGQVLVRIAASGVNPLDTKIRQGRAAHARQPLPAVLGMDMAGTVAALGPGARRFREGDAVFGMIGGIGGRQGTLADYVAVEEEMLAARPAGLSVREAAALPLVFITAWEGLLDRAALKAGQSLLVQGGAGCVGSMALMIGKARGARLFATAGAEHRDILRALGATAIDYQKDSVADYVRDLTDGAGFDVVFDTAGGAVLDASFQAVRPFGHVVSSLGWGTHALAPLSFKAASYSGIFTLLPMLTGQGKAHHGEILGEAARLAEAGALPVRLDDRHFTPASVEAAFDLVASGRATGKVVVDMTV